MALYVNGKKIVNSLIIDGNTLPIPYVVYAECVNKSAIRTITFTASNDGAYQVYVFWTNGGAAGAITDIAVKINGAAVTFAFDDTSQNYKPFAYGEVILNKNDVLTVSNTLAENNRGLIVFVMQNARISNFAVVGNATNDGSTFPIGHDSCVLECYQYSFYSGATRYNYMVVTDVANSIATPGGTSTYYYGGTWALRV